MPSSTLCHARASFPSFVGCAILCAVSLGLAQENPPPPSLPQSLADTLDRETSAPPMGGNQTLAPELGAALAGENTTVNSRGLADTLPLSTNRSFRQPLDAKPERDPLRQRRRPKSRIDVEIRGAVEYDNNIFIDGDSPEGDFIVVIAPRLAVNAGDYKQQQASYLSAAYTATASEYLSNTTEETLDHLVEVSGQWKRAKLTMPFAARFARETGTYLDLGTRDTAEFYDVQLGAKYRLSSKYAVGILGEYAATEYERAANFDDHLVEAYLSYNYSSKTAISTVYRYNQSQTDGADAQTYQAALLRFRTQPTRKLSGVVETGAAFSRLGNGDRSDLVYRLAFAYQPNSRQRLTLQALREPSTSSFTVGSGSINNALQLSYEHAMGNRLRLVLSGAYQLSDYFAADEGVFTDREEEYLTFSTLLAYDINPHWQAELFYTYSDNQSKDASLAFDNQRVGLGLTWLY